MDSRAPKGGEWNDVLEVLHAVANTITVRAHYGEGHPAVAQADAAVEKGFKRVHEGTPEVVLALVDNEFVVSERPLPQLRERLHVLADAMLRHGVECIVFQRGVRKEEATTLAQVLSAQADASGRLRDLAQQRMAHVLFRFVGAKAEGAGAGAGTGAAYLVPATEEVLVASARALGAGEALDTGKVLDLATRIVGLAKTHALRLDQRAWARSISDEAAHASNVAQITAALALDAGYTEKECVDVTAAALLHDVGHLFVPEEIRGIPEPLLEPAQRPVFRNHTYAGASLLLGAGCPPLWVAAAFEHHRGVDGGGYPGLESKTAPHDLVRIVALANFFDRKRTRIEGRADEPEDVLRAATDLESRFFGRGLVQRFVRALGVFPPGTTVELSDREPALVVRTHGGDPLRPQVQILRGPRTGKLVDLREVVAPEGRFDRSIVRSVLPPLFLPSDIVVAEDSAPPVAVAEEELDDPWSMVTPVRRRPERSATASSGPSSAEVARQELAGMGALLDDLLTVPATVIDPPRAATPSVPAMLAVTMPTPTITVAPTEPRPAAPPPRISQRMQAIPGVAVTVPPGAMDSQRPGAPSREVPAVGLAAPKPPVVVAPSTPPADAAGPEEIEILMMVGRWDEALAACEAWLGAHAADADVLELRERCLAKLGGPAPVVPSAPPNFDVRAHLASVPALGMAEAATYALPLGSEARFVLTLVDGVSSLETIADASGLPTEQALSILSDLVARGVLAVR